MTFAPGNRLGHYEITSLLGEGGMGQVYLAEDTKLHRKVALKILPPEMATDERRRRFEREARAVAALNHPNIVTIFSVEEAEGVHFITMELVKGKVLAEVIPRQGVLLDAFFETAIPLADAVSVAHEQRIIHRDLKPDNLIVGDGGRLKILDFGLAKLKQDPTDTGISELPTQSRTEEGRILGTVAYMSPEQAEGKTVDHRSDIFSMGIIFYEMATGKRPFQGDTAASILSSILKDTPSSATQIKPALPLMLGRIIRRCLIKDPDHRYQNAKDVRNELEELKQELDSGEAQESVVTAESGKRWFLPGVVAALTIVIATLGYLFRPNETNTVTNGPRSQGTFTQLTSATGAELFPSLSPDGDIVLYTSASSGNWDIYRQRVGGETAFNLTEDCEDDDTMPAFSPDGELVAFRSERGGGGLFLMGATGESVRRLTDFGHNPAWSPDGKEIVCATEGKTIDTTGRRSSSSQLWAVEIQTGEKRLITGGDAFQPSWSPNGGRIVYWTALHTGERDIWTVSAEGGEPVPVTRDAHTDWSPVWSPDGKSILFSSDRSGSTNLWRIPIDEEQGKPLGDPEPVTTGGATSQHHLCVSRDGGSYAYVEQTYLMNIWKVGFDPAAGRIRGEPIAVTQGSMTHSNVTFSPDGEWLAFWTYRGQEDIYVIRADGSDRRKLTDDPFRDRVPHWSPDGKSIAFYSNRSGDYQIWRIQSDGSELRQLTDASGMGAVMPRWSHDGSRMSYYCPSDGSAFIFDPHTPWEEQTPVPLPRYGEGKEHFTPFSWSSDGRYIAGWTRSEEGVTGSAIYSLETKEYRKLADLGYMPVWLADGRRLLTDDKKTLYLMDGISGDCSVILSMDAADRVASPAPSPDNRWIYFERISRPADIWLLTFSHKRE